MNSPKKSTPADAEQRLRELIREANGILGDLRRECSGGIRAIRDECQDAIRLMESEAQSGIKQAADIINEVAQDRLTEMELIVTPVMNHLSNMLGYQDRGKLSDEIAMMAAQEIAKQLLDKVHHMELDPVEGKLSIHWKSGLTGDFKADVVT